MRKVVLYELLSIDGVAEEPGNWMFDVDEILVENLGRVIDRQDAVLLGRNTYDYWVGYWPTSDYQPFAGFINGTTKHVFTSSTPSQEWPASTFVAAPPVDYVADLKQQSGGDIGIHGSISLARTLLRAELVDELRLVVAPAVAGDGTRLFEGEGALQQFELIDVERTGTGAVLLGYRKKSEL
jgi:dihydrofolate reductase